MQSGHRSALEGKLFFGASLSRTHCLGDSLLSSPRKRGPSSVFVANPEPVRAVSVYWVPAFAGTTTAWFVPRIFEFDGSRVSGDDSGSLYRLALIQNGVAAAIAAGLVLLEHFGHLRMPHRLAGLVRQQNFLRHKGDILRFCIFHEKGGERLI